jgi:N4-gp56 family major capsid protein
MEYGKPLAGTPSSIGSQARTDFFQKKALIEIRKEQYFTQLADVTAMPKNMGKKIKQYIYLPMLADGNLNDQGIDAAGAAITSTQYFVTLPSLVQTFVSGAAATTAAAAINAIQAGVAVAAGSVVTSTKRALIAATSAQSVTLLAAVPGSTSRQGSGNLYGSSKDIGTIAGKLPALSESGGRVNRVGFKRKDLEGTFEKFGFFDEYTKDSVDFDSDDMLQEHINREMLNGANEISEDALQIDLLNSAGVIRYAGAATQNSELVATSEVSYGDIMRLGIDLDNNRTPKSTTAISGTRMVDTKVVPGGRILYCGSEMLPTLKAMKDLHNLPAFISVEKYQAGGATVTGEEGAVDKFRVVVVPEMLKWAGAGAPVTEATHYSTNGAYDVFPMLVVGDASFTTISFQTDGKGVKFNIIHKAPGEATADRNDPYGQTGFMSILWFYGFMVLRPERIGLIKTIAKL